MCNSFLLCLFKVKVKLEPHEEQIFVDDDDEVSVSYIFLQCRPCFILLKVYLFYPEKIQIQKCNFFLYHSFEWSHRPVANPGEGPGGPPPPLFLDQTEARRAKKNCWRPPLPPPPLSKGLDDRPFPTPLISRSGSGTSGWLLLKFQISMCMHWVGGDFNSYEVLLVLFSLLCLM